MTTKDGRTPGQVARAAFYRGAADPSLTLADMWEAAAQAILDAFRDQIERDGAVKALRYAANQIEIAGRGDLISRVVITSINSIIADVESGEVKL